MRAYASNLDVDVNTTVPSGMLSSLTLVGKEFGRVGLDRVLPDGSTLPDCGKDVTTASLERITGRPGGSIRSVHVLDEHHGTAGRVRIEVDALPEADLPETLFLKLTPKSPVQRVMMSLFELGTRELLFYSEVAEDVPVRVPRCYGTDLDARRGRNLMVLEDLSTTAVFRDIRVPATVEQAAAVVDALADLHASFWVTPRFDRDLAPLRSRRAPAERLGNLFVGKVLGKVKGRSAEVIPPEMQRASRVVFEDREAIDAFWAGEPQTLCHGDTHFGNLFFEGADPGFLDWQAVMMAPGIRDISYFLILSVDPTVLAGTERELVDRYAARLAGRGIAVDAGRTWDAYRASAADAYISAVVTAGTSDRMQPAEISQVGVDRVVPAMARLETFELLARIVRDGRI